MPVAVFDPEAQTRREYPKPQASMSSVESRVRINFHKLWHRVLCHRHPTPRTENLFALS